MTTSQAARRLGVSPTTVQFMVERGDLEAWKTRGGHRRISTASVERLAELRAGGGGADATLAAGMIRVLVLAGERLAQVCTAALQRHPVSVLVVPAVGVRALLAIERNRPELLVVETGADAAGVVMFLRQLREQPEFRSMLVMCMTPAGIDLDLDEAGLCGVVVYGETSARTRLAGFVDAMVAKKQLSRRATRL
jgi:excisionase family DNA binding protein